MPKKSKKLTTREFSSQTGIPVSMVTQMIRDGKIKASKISGRWQIPEEQLGNPAVRDPSDAGPAAGRTKTSGEKHSAPPAAPPSAQRITVRDFSARTYLTDFGVVQYLKQGRLKGGRDESGQWWVDAASLTDPSLQHLLRPKIS